MKTKFACALFAVLATMLASNLRAQNGPYLYYSLAPCRLVDTRDPNGTNGGPAMLSGQERDFKVRGTCGVPLSAQAVSINVTVVTPAQGGWLAIWPSGIARPLVSSINFDSSTVALGNGAITGLSQNTNDLAVYNAGGTLHLVIDVSGYFQ
jgi:hypothetical protein